MNLLDKVPMIFNMTGEALTQVTGLIDSSTKYLEAALKVITETKPNNQGIIDIFELMDSITKNHMEVLFQSKVPNAQDLAGIIKVLETTKFLDTMHKQILVFSLMNISKIEVSKLKDDISTEVDGKEPSTIPKDGTKAPDSDTFEIDNLD